MDARELILNDINTRLNFLSFLKKFSKRGKEKSKRKNKY